MGLGALAVSTVITIGIFLFGSMDETQVRLILTTFAVGVYSLTGFAASSWKDKRFAVLGYVGLVASVLAMAMAMRFIWDNNWSWKEGEIKFTLILNIVAFAAAYSSLLFRAVEARLAVVKLVYGTIACVAAASFMLIFWILNDFEIASELYGRLTASFGVLGVVGGIALPIVKKLTSGNQESKMPEQKRSEDNA